MYFLSNFFAYKLFPRYSPLNYISGYGVLRFPLITFLNSQTKHMLWVLKWIISDKVTVLLSTQNKFYKWWIRKNSQFHTQLYILSGSMTQPAKKSLTQVTKQWPTSSGMVSYFSSSFRNTLWKEMKELSASVYVSFIVQFYECIYKYSFL